MRTVFYNMFDLLWGVWYMLLTVRGNFVGTLEIWGRGGPLFIIIHYGFKNTDEEWQR